MGNMMATQDTTGWMTPGTPSNAMSSNVSLETIADHFPAEQIGTPTYYNVWEFSQTQKITTKQAFSKDI